MRRLIDPRIIPWKAALKGYWTVRETFFAAPKKDPNLRVYADADDLRATLGTAFFTNEWEFSYDEGEDINMRRPEYVGTREGSERWCQVHVRGYVEGEYIDLACHHELEPSENPHGHLNAKHFHRDWGATIVKAILDAEYEVEDLRTK